MSLNSEKSNFLYELIKFPFFYNLLQKIMSGEKFREKIIKKNFNKKFNKEIKILDIGCGSAVILKTIKDISDSHLKNYGLTLKYVYYGYDINSKSIEFAKKNFSRFNHFFFNKKLSGSSFKNKRFDYIFLLGVLHHLNAKDSDIILKLSKKLLKKNGKLIMEDPVYINSQNFIARKIIDFDKGNFVRSDIEQKKLCRTYLRDMSFKVYHEKFIPYTWFIGIS